MNTLSELSPAAPNPVQAAAPSSGWLPGRRWLFLVVGLGLLLRLGWIAATAGTPMFDKYFWLSERLVAVGWFPRVAFGDCPLYIYLLGVLHVVLGLGETGIRVVQALASSLTVLLAWRSGRILAGPVGGLTAAAVLAFYPALVLYDTQPMPCTWINLANAAALAAILSWSRRPRVATAAATGLFLGCSILLRPTILLWLPFLLFFFFVARGTANRLKSAATFLAVIVLTVAPITLVNVLGGGEFVLVTGSGGLNVFGGNNPRSNPLTATWFPVVRETQGQIMPMLITQPITAEHLAYRRVAGWLLGHEAGARESSRFWNAETLTYARRAPGHFLGGLLRKARFFVHPTEAHDTESASQRWRPLTSWGTIVFCLLWPAGLLGLWRSRRETALWLPVQGLFLTYLATIVLFYVSSRLRLPVVLPLALAAGAVVSTLAGDWREGRRRRAGLVLASLLLVGLALGWPTAETRRFERVQEAYVGHYAPAVELFRNNDRAEALPEFARALAIEPTMSGIIRDFLEPYRSDGAVADFLDGTVTRLPSSGTDPRTPAGRDYDRGIGFFREERYREAVAAFDAALGKWTFYWEAAYARGLAKGKLGDAPGALADLERAFRDGRKFQVGTHRIYHEMALAAVRARDWPAAERYARLSLFVKPDNPPAREVLTALGKPP